MSLALGAGGGNLVSARQAVGGLALPRHPEVMRSAGGLQLDAAFERLIVEPVQHLLILFRRHHLLGGDIHSASHRHQQEGVQCIGAEGARQVEHGRQLVRVVARDRGVDLHRNSQLLQVAHAVDGGVERAGNAAERIVSVRVRPVQRDRDPLDSGMLDLLRDVFGYQRSVGGQRDAQTAAGGVFGQLENVVTVERFTAAEHEDGIAEVGNLGNDVERFVGRQIGRRHQLGRGSAAVDAAQVTALGNFPENQARRVLFGGRWMGTAVALAHCCFSSPALAELGSWYASKIGF